MERKIILLLAGFLLTQSGVCQLSFSEKRLRDKTYYEGVALIHELSYEQASEKMSACLEADSTFAPAYLQKGRIFIEWGQTEQAMMDLDSALRFDPHLGEAWFYKGYLYFHSDSITLDVPMFEKAISEGFDSPHAHYFRALTRIREGRDEEALEDLNRALELKEDYALAYHERAGVRKSLGDMQGAHFDYSTAIQYEPVFPLAYNNLGSVKIVLGDYQGAIEDFNTAFEQDSMLALALNNRGYAHFFFGDMDAALEDLNMAISLDSTFGEACLNKAALLAGQDQVKEAISLLDAAISDNPDMALLYLNRGLIREMAGNLAGACEDWSRAEELGSDQAAIYVKECKD